MEYPPTFEPESYTLNLSPEAGAGFASPPPHQPTPTANATSPVGTTTPHPHTRSPSPPNAAKSSGTSQGYINISHVSSTLAELSVKSFHHNIYVTSPCRERLPARGTGKAPPVPPNKPTRGTQFSPLHATRRASDRTPSDSASSPGSRQTFFGSPLSASSPSPTSTEATSPQESTNNSYLPMGVVYPSHRFQGVRTPTRVRLGKPPGGDESKC